MKMVLIDPKVLCKFYPHVEDRMIYPEKAAPLIRG